MDGEDEDGGVVEEDAKGHPAKRHCRHDGSKAFACPEGVGQHRCRDVGLGNGKGDGEDDADDEKGVYVRLLPTDHGRLVPRKRKEDEAGNAEEGANVVEPLETESRKRRANAVWNYDQGRDAEEEGANGPEPEAPPPGDLFGEGSTNEPAKDVPRRSAKAEERKRNVLLHRKRRESSRQERKRVGYQGAVTDARHCSGEIEEDDIIRKAAEERPNGHPDPSKREDILVAKMVSQSPGDQDGDTAAKRVCRQEPRRLSVACHIESATDLLHGVCRVTQTSHGKELRQADDEDKDGLLKRRREIGGWSSCVWLASATGSGDAAI